MSMLSRPIRILAVLSLAITVACSKGGLEIYAPPEFAEGDVLVDGTAAGKLSKQRYNYRWRGWKNLRDELSAPPRHESFATISGLATGAHDISVVKEGYVPIRVRLNHRQGGRSVIDVWGAKVQRAPASATR